MLLSLLSERREMSASEKCHPGIGCWIEPRSSCTEGVCATDAPLHIHCYFITGCKTIYSRKCTFPFNYDNQSSDACYLDKTLKTYKCPIDFFYEDGEPIIEECNQLCPVECERGLTYNCNGECIPFNKPCSEDCLGILN